MASYSPEAVRAQLEKIIDAACDAEMKQHGWVPDSGTYHSTEYEGHIPMRASAVECSLTYIRPHHVVHTQLPGAVPTADGEQYAIDVATSIFKPWVERLTAMFEGWDELPLASNFQDAVDAAREAVGMLTLEAGFDQSGGDTTSDGDLYANVKYVDDWVGPDAPTAYTGNAISAFDYSYGAARQVTVIGNQRQAMIAVGLCLAGAQNLWLKAGEDVMTLMDNAEVAFHNLESPEFDIAANKVYTDVIGLFAIGGLKPVLELPGKIVDGAEKVSTLLGEVVPQDEAEEVDAALSGGDPDEVATKLEGVLTDLNNAFWTQEKALIAPLRLMKDDLLGDPSAYHIHPKPGYDADLHHSEVLRVDSAALNKAMGTALPIIAGQLARAANKMDRAGSANPWWRSWNIGYGFNGAFPELGQLTTLVAETCRSSAKELVGATRLLAEALGVIDAVDADISSHLGGVEDDIRGAGLRFPDDPGDPRAPRDDFHTLPNGKQVPI